MKFVQIRFGIELVESFEPDNLEGINAVLVNGLVGLLLGLFWLGVFVENERVGCVYVLVGEGVAGV